MKLKLLKIWKVVQKKNQNKMKSSQSYSPNKPVKSIQGSITPEFIDYCNEKEYSLTEWYEWRMHIINERKKLENGFTTDT